MKKNLLTIFAIIISTQLQATIYRLGYLGLPVPGKDFGYTDFGNAQNAASPGDTIQIYQQLNNVQSNIDVSKHLVFIGYGHTLQANTGLQVQNKVDSNTNLVNITFHPGSAFSSIQGLNLGTASIRDSNITITRCRFRSHLVDAGYPPCNGGPNLMFPTGGACVIGEAWNNLYLPNITINGCYFDGNNIGNENCIINGNYASTLVAPNLNISNNYINGIFRLYTGINGQITGVFSNNIVNTKFQHLQNVYHGNSNICTQGTIGGYMPAPQTSTFDYFLIKNNIFNTDDTVTCPIIAPNCIIQNNIFSTSSSYACTGLGGSNNIYGADMNQVFSAAWNDGFVYNDNQLTLGLSSPAINAGVKGDNSATNCGIYGGELGQSYKQSGIPPIPAVYQLSTPSVNATSNPYNITISVRSNN